MFVVSSTHLIPREALDHLASAQAQWLKAHHDAGHFVASGSNVERNAGAILAIGLNRDSLDDLMQESPYVRAQASRYEIIEVSHLPTFF